MNHKDSTKQSAAPEGKKGSAELSPASSSPKLRIASVAESNDALHDLLERIGLFLDSMHFPIAIINVEGRYVYYNKESAELDGCSQAFALNNLLLNVYPNMKPEESTQLHTLYTGESFVSHPQNYFNARGKLLNYLHTTTPLYGPGRTIIGVIEIGWDASQVEKLQNQVLMLTKRLSQERARKSEKASLHEDLPAIVTASPRMKKLMEMAERYAVTDVPVVILGESGTGKELLAQFIYKKSQRRDKPFVTLNCGALTENLIASSLFGTVKGAFTGAENAEGYLDIADGGTLFLDEFNSIPGSMQVKLLRFLQNKTYSRVGSPKVHRSDVRVIVAMNEMPSALIREGRLRPDLYWRLSVAELEIPALRDRIEDIPLLVGHFIRKYAPDMPYQISGIDEAALRFLCRQSWPGNIRILENVIVRSMALQQENGPLRKIAEGFGFTTETNTIFREEPVEDVPLSDDPRSFEERVEDFERNLIGTALRATNWNVTAASEMLSINRTTLLYKLKKLGIARRGISPDN